MRGLTTLSPFLVALALACAAPAWAQGSDETRRAKEYFLKGKKAYEQGLYEEAMKNFKLARAVRPSPILEYNIARCFDKLGQTTEAINAYKRYLVFRPNASNRETVEARIAALKASSPRPVAPAPPTTTTAPATTDEPEEPGQPGAAPGKPAPTSQPTTEPTPASTPELGKRPAATARPPASKAPVHEAVAARNLVAKKKAAAPARPPATPAPGDRQQTPIYKQWYFWVALAGAVVITGFIIGMAVDPDDRTISSSPHTVTSPPGRGGMTVLTF